MWPRNDRRDGLGRRDAARPVARKLGDYAIAVYHDQNGNGKMDKRMFGIPKEPYGFSNNIKPVMSAPKFSECRFTVGDSGKVISIKLL